MQKLLSFARTIFAFLLLITVVVAVHEFAHLLTAVAFGATVESFSIGFGPEVIGFEAWGIYWKISALPLGGFVGFPIEAGPGVVLVDSLSTAAQMTIMLSGVVANAILAVAIAFVMRKKYNNDPSQYTMELNMKGFLIVPFFRNAGLTLKQGQRYFWWFVASTSLDLMLFNALFIFPLDGGRVWMLLIYDVFGLNWSFGLAFFVGLGVSFTVLLALLAFITSPLLKYVMHASDANDYFEEKRAEERRLERQREREAAQLDGQAGDGNNLPPGTEM